MRILRKGNDTLDGGGGIDTVIFTGIYPEYRISKRGNKVIVTDTVVDRDGDNTLANIEKLRFSDRVINVTEL